LFNDIENTPTVRHRKSVVGASSYILFADANREGDEAPSPKIPVPAGPVDCIEVNFITSIEADSILGLGIYADVQAGTKSQLAGFTIVCIWDVHNEASSFPETIQSSKRFAKCKTMKPGDTVVELHPNFGDTLEEYSFILLYRYRRVVPGEAIRQLYIIPRRDVTDGELEPARCTISRVRGVKLTSNCTVSNPFTYFSRCTGYLDDGGRCVIYRVLLYCDDFQPHSSTTSSYGGCYMLTMGIPPAQRAGYGAVRCIGLTTPQMSTNEVLQNIGPTGNAVTIFIDVLGFIGDYLAI
jgi:hypothetical protein